VERLISLGAEKVFDDEIHALYYDFPDNSIRRKGCTLRLRRKVKICLHTKKGLESTEAKIRESMR